MIIDKSPSSTTSESLESLLPRRSKARIVLWAAVFVVAVWCAWVAPTVLHPDMRLGDTAASTSVDGTPFLLEHLTFSAQGWPSVTVVEANGFPGANVVSAWLATDDQADKFLSQPIADRPATVDSLLAGISATSIPISQLQALPAKVSDGAKTNLLLVWKITDCQQALARGDQPVLRLVVRSSWGIERTVTFPQRDNNPEWFAADGSNLEESGLCR